MQSISIIGIGRLGGALALALSKAGYRIDNLVHRSRSTPSQISNRLEPNVKFISFQNLENFRSDIVLITSPDPEIELIASQIATKVKSDALVFHASGSLSSEILHDLAELGCGTGSIHPLVSVSDPVRGSEQFAGAFFCVEGREDAVATAKSIVTSLDGTSFSIESRFKPLYHAAAVTASGHLVALADVATEMLSNCGVPTESAKRILMPLIRSTVANLEMQSGQSALTGTFARADLPAFERHMEAISNLGSDQIRNIYLELGMRSLALLNRGAAGTEEALDLEERIKLALQSAK